MPEPTGSLLSQRAVTKSDLRERVLTWPRVEQRRGGGGGGGGVKVTGTFQDNTRQMYDCQLVGQRFEAGPNSE